MKGLSPKQKLVLSILEDAVREGEQLTVREIGDRIGVSSTCTVHQHLKALERKGFLKPTNHRHRSLQLTSPPRPFVTVPFCGQAVAGDPVGQGDFEAEGMQLPTELVGLGESKLFQVSGNGLADSAIRSGDVVVVLPDRMFSSGDVVVAHMNGKVVIRQLADEESLAHDAPDLQVPSVEGDWATGNGSSLLGRVALVIRRL